MEYLGFIFGIFGLLAYLQSASLKRRIDALEEQLAKTRGTEAFETRASLISAVQSYIGSKVTIDLKEDHEDVDVMMYGNTKHGSITILDADEDWMLVRIESPKGTKEKLLRLASVERISLVQNNETSE
ncbi:MAG: hypothetical protein IJH91_03495 [Mogibacterium sp.]|nr:hypothetical protein [Mogibacterium sp.]